MANVPNKVPSINPPIILIFTWNTDGLNICKSTEASSRLFSNEGTLNVFKSDDTTQTSLIGTFKCAVPNFMESFRTKVAQLMKGIGKEGSTPDIMVFATQGEPTANTEFKKFLSSYIISWGYEKLIFDELNKIEEPYTRIGGYTTSLKQLKPSHNSIRQSVFVLKSFKERIDVWREKFSFFDKIIVNEKVGHRTKKCDQDQAPAAGGIVTYLKIRNYSGFFAFVNVHLPDIVADKDNLLPRATIAEKNKQCLDAIIEHLLNNDGEDADKFDLNYIFIAGDLNYRIVNTNSYEYIASNNNLSIKQIANHLYEYDEFNIQRKQIQRNQRQGGSTSVAITKMHEGVNYPYFNIKRRNFANIGKNVANNQKLPDLGPGPEFLPTWKLQSIDIRRENKDDRYKRRVSNCINQSDSKTIKNRQQCYDTCEDPKSKDCGKLPAWRDRILYMNKGPGTAKAQIVCTNYEMFDYDNITYSDHAAVIGLFTLLGDDQFERIAEENEARSRLKDGEKRIGEIVLALEKLERTKRKGKGMSSKVYNEEKTKLENESNEVRNELRLLSREYPQYTFYYTGKLPKEPTKTRINVNETYIYTYINSKGSSVKIHFHVDNKDKAYYFIFDAFDNNRQQYITFDFSNNQWLCYSITNPDDVRGLDESVECTRTVSLDLPLEPLPEKFSKESLKNYITSKKLEKIESTIYYKSGQTKQGNYDYLFRTDKDKNVYYILSIKTPNLFYKFNNKKKECFEVKNNEVKYITCPEQTSIPPPLESLPTKLSLNYLNNHKKEIQVYPIIYKYLIKNKNSQIRLYFKRDERDEIHYFFTEKETEEKDINNVEDITYYRYNNKNFECYKLNKYGEETIYKCNNLSNFFIENKIESFTNPFPTYFDERVLYSLLILKGNIEKTVYYYPIFNYGDKGSIIETYIPFKSDINGNIFYLVKDPTDNTSDNTLDNTPDIYIDFDYTKREISFYMFDDKTYNKKEISVRRVSDIPFPTISLPTYIDGNNLEQYKTKKENVFSYISTNTVSAVTSAVKIATSMFSSVKGLDQTEDRKNTYTTLGLKEVKKTNESSINSSESSS